MMRGAGVTDYARFAHEVLEAIGDRPISFEVCSDDAADMERQARSIAAWPGNVYVKIPITNTSGDSMAHLVKRLSADGIKVNVTALTTTQQVASICPAFEKTVPGYVSLFAGRIADTGTDPVPAVREASSILRTYPKLELIWASPREVLNMFQADEAGCDIITMTEALLKKLPMIGKSLESVSLETVQMFYRDATASRLAP